MLKLVTGGGSGRIAAKVDIVTDIEMIRWMLESNPSPPVREARIVTTVLRGSQLPTSLSFYLIYDIQEETYIRRIPSEEETKAEPDPSPNANVTFAC